MSDAPTIAELADQAFQAGERVRMLNMMNTPQDYEERRKAIAEARAEELAATRALNKAIGDLLNEALDYLEDQ